MSAVVLGTSAALAIASAPKIARAPQANAEGGAADGGHELVIQTLVAANTADTAEAGPPLLLSDERPFLATDSGAGVLGDTAPRQLRWGVVLVQFAGCQGAAPNARSKADALDLANKLADEAKKDFHEAVRHGDPGSTDDAGRIPRGVLEPAVEFALFSLSPGTTSDPIETPRGYYVMRRSDGQ